MEESLIMSQEIKKEPKLLSASAEQRRIRRAQMTDEELKEVRAVEAERARQKRAQLSETELEIRRARDAAKKREKRRCTIRSDSRVEDNDQKNQERPKIIIKEEPGKINIQETESVIQPEITKEYKRDAKVRSAAAEQKRRRRAQMTDEEKRQLRAVEAERARQKRARMTAEEIERRRAREAERKRQQRGKMSEEDREKRCANWNAKLRKKQSEMTEEELKRRRAQKVEYQRQRMARWTEEERKIFRAKKCVSDRRKKQANGTSVERIRSMVAQVGVLAYNHSMKYEVPATFFKNSLCDMLSLHADIEKLRKTARQTVAAAVKNAVNLHRIQKQSRAGGYGSSTFVEVGTRPLQSKRTSQQEFTTGANLPDPLIDQPNIPTLSCGSPMNETRNENPTKDQTEGSFNVCPYGAPEGSAEKNSDNSKRFQCPICSKRFETSLGYTIHQKEHISGPNEFQCPICRQIFNTYDLMTTHYFEGHSSDLDANEVEDEAEGEEKDEVLERHKQEFEFSLSRKCFVCFQAFDMQRLEAYRIHVISEHSDNKELLKNFSYCCARCEKPHTVLSSLESHWKTFCFERWKSEYWNNGGIVCDKCGMNLANEKSFSSHTRIYHSEKKKAVCDQCGKEFKGAISLKMHIKAMHETKTAAEYKFTCEHCGKVFRHKQNLVKHTKIVHLGEKRFACKLCDKRFENNLKLEEHMNTHTGEKPFKCKYCEKCFSTRTGLRKHHEQHEGGTYKPNKMGEKSSGNNSAHHGNYKCDICRKAFKSSTTLRDHKYTHDTAPRFGCSLCEKTFRQKNNFYRHKLKEHPNQNPQILRLASDEAKPSNVFANLLPMCNNDVSSSHYTPQIPPPMVNPNLPRPYLEPQYYYPPYYPQYYPGLPSTLYNHPEAGNSSVSNMSLETQYSQDRDDYSPEMHYDNDNADEDPPTLMEIGGLRSVNRPNNVSLPASNDAGLISFQKTVCETKAKDFVEPVPHSSGFIDFSRANVPTGISTLIGDTSDAAEEEPKNAAKIKTLGRSFTEDSEQDSFAVDLDMNDFVKIKIEASDGFDNESPKVKVRSEASILAQEKYWPCPIVKLPKLLEYYCVPCDKTIFMATRREIRKHRRAHPKIKKMRVLKRVKVKKERSSEYIKRKMSGFDCLYCDLKNMSGDKVVKHCLAEHPGQKPLQCRQCPKMLNSIDTFYAHKTKFHNPPKPKPPRDPNAPKEMLCEVCGKAFHTKQAVWVHKSIMHRGNIEVECDICHKIIRGRHNLKLHKNRHLGIKPHLCEECGMGFATPLELKDHVRVIHRGEKKRPKQIKTNKTHPFPCIICPCRFVKEKGLQKHMDLHDPERKYPCDECGFRFKTYDIRFAHIKFKHNKVKYLRKPRKPKGPVLTDNGPPLIVTHSHGQIYNSPSSAGLSKFSEDISLTNSQSPMDLIVPHT